MQLTSLGVRRAHTAHNLAEALHGAPVRNIQHVRNDPPAEFLVGSFRHADGRRAVVLVNHDLAYTAWPTVVFDAAAAEVREVDKATGREVALGDDSPELPGVQVSFGPGDARLFILPR
jgi:acyl-CoA synthetase (NDP forming)